jgi:hypothetical protein
MLSWDGTDGMGRAKPAGIYFVRVMGTGWQRSVKVLLLP